MKTARNEEAQRNYPLNCWWVAAFKHEVTQDPLCRWILGQRIVLFRIEDGTVAALEDRCAHRWAPLSQGSVVGNEIVCPYHGFRYNSLGTCTMIPVRESIPSAVKVRSYPVHEHGPFVWIWTGDPARANAQPLPDAPWSSDPSRLMQGWYVGELKCNYLLVHENVLDLTHIPHLHGNTLMKDSPKEEHRKTEPKMDIRVTSHSVTILHPKITRPLAPLFATQMGVESGKTVTFEMFSSFVSPACHINGVEIEDHSPGMGHRSRYTDRSFHCVTPISWNRCHYFHARSQDYGHHLSDIEGYSDSWVKAVLKQDADVLEGIQETIEKDLRAGEAPEMLMSTDRPIVEMRRIVARMIQSDATA